MGSIRETLWAGARRLGQVQEGQILPRWLVAVRALLYPLDFFYWRMSERCGYQWRTDTWLIGGVSYSAEGLRSLARAEGKTLRVVKVDETVTLELIGTN